MRKMDSGLPLPGHKVAIHASNPMSGTYEFQSFRTHVMLSIPRTDASADRRESMRGDVSMQVRVRTCGDITSEYVPGPDPISRTSSPPSNIPSSIRRSTMRTGMSPCCMAEYWSE